MFVTLVEKLVERTIQLLRERRQSERDVFNLIVQPIYEEFESVHAQYQSAFREYRDFTTSDAYDIHELIDMVRKEYLLSEGQRAKLRTLRNNDTDPRIQPFIQSVCAYLTAPDDDGSPYGPQMWHSSLLRSLTALDRHLKGQDDERGCPDYDVGRLLYEKKEPRRIATELVDITLQKMQTLYGDVGGEYLKLRQELLV